MQILKSQVIAAMRFVHTLVNYEQCQQYSLTIKLYESESTNTNGYRDKNRASESAYHDSGMRVNSP